MLWEGLHKRIWRLGSPCAKAWSTLIDSHKDCVQIGTNPTRIHSPLPILTAVPRGLWPQDRSKGRASSETVCRRTKSKLARTEPNEANRRAVFCGCVRRTNPNHSLVLFGRLRHLPQESRERGAVCDHAGALKAARPASRARKGRPPGPSVLTVGHPTNHRPSSLPQPNHELTAPRFWKAVAYLRVLSDTLRPSRCSAQPEAVSSNSKRTSSQKSRALQSGPVTLMKLTMLIATARVTTTWKRNHWPSEHLTLVIGPINSRYQAWLRVAHRLFRLAVCLPSVSWRRSSPSTRHNEHVCHRPPP